ncbi:MAG: DUF58 domain-containing protein [Pyrinomonadaceae bacterium]
MNLKLASQLFSFRDLRNAVLGGIVVIGGLGLAGLTLYAQQTANMQLTVFSAVASLVFVLLILVFIVPPLARNAGREASQMNLPFEFTTGGAVMLVLVLIVGFSAWNTGNNLLFLVLSFLIAALIVGFFAGSICLKKLDVTMRFPETIFAGEPTPILASINNRKRIFPSFSVVVEVRGKERERSIAAADLDAILPKWAAVRLGRAPVVHRTLNHFVHIAARQTIEARSEQVFPHRGRLRIKDFELSTKFPFGFFRHRRRLPAREAELIVFPKVIDVSSDVESVPLDLGQQTSGKRGMGQDLLALRDYRAQDDLRRIDWKATARTRQLTVREFAAENENRMTVIFDSRVPSVNKKIRNLRDKLAAEQGGQMVVASEQFESGASIAASILTRFTNEKAESRLVIDGEADEYGTGRSHLNISLKRLSVAEPHFESRSAVSELGSNLERILNESDDSHCFLVTANGTDGLSSDIVQRLKIIGF